MGLVDDVVFRARGAHGCSNSDYDFALTTCCERVGVVDNELDDFYWDFEAPSRSVSLLQESNCPFCEAASWSLRLLDDMNDVPEHWRWACDGQARPGRRVVRSLAAHVAELLNFCRRVASPLPKFDAILFLNTADARVRYQGGWAVAAGALRTTADFAPIFDQLIVTGYSWINLSAYGIFRGDLIVGVELPREQVGVDPGLTSVSYSGPSLMPDGTPNWQLDLQITD